jgi:PiT family inorganic phosphate transporter
MFTFIIVVLAATIFEYTNGFHDAANAIATVVSTKVLTPRQAIAMAAFFNLTGAMLGGAVASTVGKGLVDTNVVTMTTVLCALIAAFIWNMATWWFGLPSSSSHALIGGLCGAALATAHGNWSVIKWSTGLWPKVIVPMFSSPIAGFVLGGLIMLLLFVALHRFTPHFVHSTFGKLQIFSAAWMAHSHGTNDAQKTMGIITLALFTGTKAGSFNQLPSWLEFLRTPTFVMPTWVKVLCALTMAAGTAAGGWRIIRTLGHRVVKLQPVHGFAAETTAALIIQGASLYGIPLSTTHVISTSIMGVGTVKRFSGMKWTVVERIIWAWIFTLPATALIGYLLERAVVTFGST